jgi:hypothetical protein
MFDHCATARLGVKAVTDRIAEKRVEIIPRNATTALAEE